MSKWMIYGATGYTGNLIIQRAVRENKLPVIAGRNENKLKKLAENYGLEYRVFTLESKDEVIESINDIDVVYNLAGPYSDSSLLLIEACLSTRTHYLDLCGEISVLKKYDTYNEEAIRKGVLILPNAGFHAIVTDCVAKMATEMVDKPKSLDLFFLDATRPSPGTLKSSLDAFVEGGLQVINGILSPMKLGTQKVKIKHDDKEFNMFPSPMAELLITHKSTGVLNITTFLKFPPIYELILKYLATPLKLLLQSNIKNFIYRQIDKYVKGPDRRMNYECKSEIGVIVYPENGTRRELWLTAPEAYFFTAKLVVKAVEKILKTRISGVKSPSEVFGCDFLKEFIEISINPR